MTALGIEPRLVTRIADHDAMVKAANAWGQPGDEDRRWFLAGWRDHADGEELKATLPATPTEPQMCAYFSGWIASRDRHRHHLTAARRPISRSSRDRR